MTIRLLDNSEVAIDCPECKEAGRGSVKLIVKTNRKSGYGNHQFLACINFPTCLYTRPIPESMLMRAMGQDELF
jgi:ssDNA-binding Zn-finger/Zn-ribbon topoisomerase 1